MHHPVVGVDYFGPLLVDYPAQGEHRFRVGKRRVVLAIGGEQEAEALRRSPDAIDPHGAVVLEGRLIPVPESRHRHLVAASGQFPT